MINANANNVARVEVQYATKSGDTYIFDQTPEKVKDCSGFFPSERVHTPRGYGTVIGWNGGHVWVHVDGDRGASYWDDCKNPDDFERKDIWLVDKDNKPIKRPPVKKFLVQFETSSKVAKLEVPQDLDDFVENLRRHLKLSSSSDHNDSSERCPLKLKYFSAEFDEFVDLDCMYNLSYEKVLKVKVERGERLSPSSKSNTSTVGLGLKHSSDDC